MPKTTDHQGRQDSPAGSETSLARKKPLHAGITGSPAVRVLCVDDHAVLVEGLKAQFGIDNHIQCVGYLSSAANLLDEVSHLKPDVVLLDIEMPGPDVFEMADRLHHQHSKVRFIFLSAHVRDGYLAAAYKCGASGYLAKGDDLEDIIAAIREVARSDEGVFVMGPKVRLRCQPTGVATTTARSKRAKSDARPPTALEGLTPREIEVLRLIGKGLPRTEIARELSRSAKTVDGHQERVMKKLGIKSRAELMRFAIREGLAEA